VAIAINRRLIFGQISSKSANPCFLKGVFSFNKLSTSRETPEYKGFPADNFSKKKDFDYV
jgi:hypothetical protein